MASMARAAPIAPHSRTPSADHAGTPVALTRCANRSDVVLSVRKSSQVTMAPCAPSLAISGDCCWWAATQSATPSACHWGVPAPVKVGELGKKHLVVRSS